MIAHINGRLTLKSMDSVVVDVGGVGYELVVPLSTYQRLPDVGQAVSMAVCTYLKDDSIQLYGFLTHEEKRVFQMLLGVSGIGPKLACNILSGVSADELVSFISRGDVRGLSSVPGLGCKTAERLILELKDKIGVVEKKPVVQEDPLRNDVISALSNLGYRNQQAEEAVKKAQAILKKDAGFEDLLRTALRMLMAG